jgi:hypothetical protein
MNWLPKVLTPGIRFIVTTLECESLQILKTRAYPLMEIGMFLVRNINTYFT